MRKKFIYAIPVCIPSFKKNTLCVLMSLSRFYSLWPAPFPRIFLLWPRHNYRAVSMLSKCRPLTSKLRNFLSCRWNMVRKKGTSLRPLQSRKMMSWPPFGFELRRKITLQSNNSIRHTFPLLSFSWKIEIAECLIFWMPRNRFICQMWKWIFKGSKLKVSDVRNEE